MRGLQISFPKKTLSVVVRKERHEKPNVSDIGKLLSPIIRNEFGRKFSCAKNDCLLKRHPYFRIGIAFYEERRD